MEKYSNVLLTSKKYRLQRDYWINILEDLEIEKIIQPSYGVERIKPDGESKEKTIKYKLDKEISDKVIRLGKNSDISIYVILLAAFNCLLYRYTRKEDLYVISPIYKANKSINDIVLIRNKIKPDMNFRELLMTTKESVIGAYNNQDYPFDKIIEELEFKEKSTSNNIFDLLFLSESIHNKDEINSRKFNFIISFLKVENEIEFIITFDTNKYISDEISNIIGFYFRVLDQAINNLSMSIMQFEILSLDEKKYLIEEFNNTFCHNVKFKTMDKLFEEQVKQSPNAIAIRFDDKEITYKELNIRANKLARAIIQKGIKSNDIVGIIIDRCPELIIGILAIIKAGAGYLPIDPEYPVSRINYMIDNSKTKLLLSNKKLNDKIDFIGDYLNVGDFSINQNDENDLDIINELDNLVYVIYTSGSTGKPKGVMIEQKGLVNYILWAKKTYVGNEKLDFPLYSSISFDLTVTSIFTPLLSGNSIVIYKEDDSDFLIRKVIQDDKVGIIKTTPTHLTLIKDMEFTNFNLKKIIVGGEDFKRELAIDILKKFNRQLEIYNEYGPTEATIGCMIYKFNPKQDKMNSVPIGIPAENMQIYILDKYLCPVPKLVEGEIYIGGYGIARGYLNNQELTEERFIDNVFTGSSKLYKTGDIGRHLLDGNIEFIGRTDSQVKIRGFRIELDEIEKVIAQFENIKEVVVVDREDVDKNKYICAYFISDKDISISELKAYVSSILPEYMIPSYFVMIDSIPINNNGKLDKKLLVDPHSIIVSKAKYICPTNDTERMLCDIWKSILDVKLVGIDDNFFEIGGHSLKVTVLMSEVYRAFNKQIPLKAILNNATIRELAKFIDDFNDNDSIEKHDNVILLNKGNDKYKNLFFIHGGSGEIENYIQLSINLNIDYNCWGIKADKLSHYNPINISISEIANSYVDKIREIQPHGPYSISGWCVGGTIAFEIAKQLEQANEKVEYISIINSIPPQSNIEFWGEVNEFSNEGEYSIIDKFLKNSIFEFDLKSIIQKDNKWEYIIEYIEKNDVNNEILNAIRKEIPSSVVVLIPNFEQANIREIIYYLNMSRTLYNARAFYIPEQKLSTQMYFFEANSNKIESKDRWNLFTSKKIKQYEINGDHFSIFDAKNIKEFSDEFEKSIY